MLFSALLAGLLLVAAPGPTNALIAARAAHRGYEGGRTILPVIAAYTLTLAVYGAAYPFVDAAPWVLQGLKLVCAAWLCALAVRSWRLERRSGIGGGSMLVTTLLNPKPAALALGLTPLIGVAGALAFGVTAAALAAALWLRLGVALGALGGLRHVNRASAAIALAFAGVLVGSAGFSS